VATRIEADVLIPGAGDPVPNGCVVFEGPGISYAGPVECAPSGSSSDTVISGKAVLPGLWDCHTHFHGVRKESLEEGLATTAWLGVLRSTKDAEKAIAAGFTSVRELGGYGIRLAPAVNEGTILGPHIYASGTQLTPTAGPGDSRLFALEMVRIDREMNELPGPCDGVPECLLAVRKVLRLGAAVVKVFVSGAITNPATNPQHQTFSMEELRAIVEEAARSDRAVAAHAHGKAGIMAALRAGARTIEHGTYLDDEAVELMLEKQAIFVPTRWIMNRAVEMGEKLAIPSEILAREREVSDRHREALRLAVRRHVPIALGTDTFGSGEGATTYWGGNGHELPLMVDEGGMTPLEAIEAGTAMGPRTLGALAPRSGQLRAGYASDVILLREDPLKRIAALADPRNVLRVWKDGRPVVGRPDDPGS
jgi:imidazolonepropionase-like amidohydrolase